MELQALLVLCGLGVVVVAVLLLMGLFSATGTSYEDAIAQQRKAATELLALAENKNKPKKNVKKANKKLAKKEKNKENSATVTSSELESEAPAESGVEDDPAPPVKAHVEFCPPVVVDLPRDTPPNVKIRKRGKDHKIKPILLNKEDPSCVSDPSSVPLPADTTITNHFEELQPKDEFELLHSSLAADKTIEKIEDAAEKKENKPAKPVKIAKVAVKAPPPADAKEIKDEGSRERRNSSELPKEQRKAKKVEKKSPAEEPVEQSRDEVVPPLNPPPQPAELTTEKLLKQALGAAPAPVAPTPSPPSTKSKKKKPEPNVLSLMAAGDSSGVNVGELVRVVREAVLSRTEIQILTDALLNKQHDPLPQHSEWTEGPNDPVQKLKKQLADKEKALADEVEASQALQAKLKELRANLNAERARAASASAAAAAAAAAGARAAEQERARSEQTAASARAELHTLQSRLQRLLEENHVLAQDKIMSEAALVQQLNALQAKLNEHALEADQARMELGAARDSMIMAQQHTANLTQQLQDANRAYSELEQHTQQERRQLQEKLSELQNEVQKLTNQAQIAEKNVENLKDQALKVKSEGDNLKEEMEKQRQQLSSEISSLREQLAFKETELAELKQIKVVATPTQNGLPPASNENEQQKLAELAKVESVVQALRTELEAAQRSNSEQRDQLHALNDQLRAYQDKNNELRTKNWKVMEALQTAEKALQLKSSNALPAQDLMLEAVAKAQETQYKEIADVLRAVCPSAAPGTPLGRDWLQTFADNIKAELDKREIIYKEVKVASAAPSATDDRLNDLKGQNEYLQSLVDKYKIIIEDTEGVLCRLQEHVTREEERWAVQLADKQRELDDLRQRTVLQMQRKIDTLQSDLQQAKGANQNHSFADAERLTQERLMMDVSNKHMDVHNGPAQIGMEEK